MGTKAKLSTKVISIVLSALMAFSCVYVALPTLAPKAFAATAEEKAWQELHDAFESAFNGGYLSTKDWAGISSSNGAVTVTDGTKNGYAYRIVAAIGEVIELVGTGKHNSELIATITSTLAADYDMALNTYQANFLNTVLDTSGTYGAYTPDNIWNGTSAAMAENLTAQTITITANREESAAILSDFESINALAEAGYKISKSYTITINAAAQACESNNGAETGAYYANSSVAAAPATPVEASAKAQLQKIKAYLDYVGTDEFKNPFDAWYNNGNAANTASLYQLTSAQINTLQTGYGAVRSAAETCDAVYVEEYIGSNIYAAHQQFITAAANALQVVGYKDYVAWLVNGAPLGGSTRNRDDFDTSLPDTIEKVLAQAESNRDALNSASASAIAILEGLYPGFDADGSYNVDDSATYYMNYANYIRYLSSLLYNYYLQEIKAGANVLLNNGASTTYSFSNKSSQFFKLLSNSVGAGYQEGTKYVLTSDSHIDQDKTYYTPDATYSYAATADVKVDGEKRYFTNWAKVESPVASGLAGYYEDVEVFTYALTEDTELKDGTAYYTLADGVYTAVEEPVAENLGTYYVRTGSYHEYQKTADTAVSATKVYYAQGEYTVVTSPSDAYIGTYAERTAQYSYQPTADKVLMSGKTYYTAAGEEIEEPTLDDIATYYEMKFKVVAAPTAPYLFDYYEVEGAYYGLKGVGNGEYVSADYDYSETECPIDDTDLDALYTFFANAVTMIGKARSYGVNISNYMDSTFVNEISEMAEALRTEQISRGRITEAFLADYEPAGSMMAGYVKGGKSIQTLYNDLKTMEALRSTLRSRYSWFASDPRDAAMGNFITELYNEIYDRVQAQYIEIQNEYREYNNVNVRNYYQLKQNLNRVNDLTGTYNGSSVKILTFIGQSYTAGKISGTNDKGFARDANHLALVYYNSSTYAYAGTALSTITTGVTNFNVNGAAGAVSGNQYSHANITRYPMDEDWVHNVAYTAYFTSKSTPTSGNYNSVLSTVQKLDNFLKSSDFVKLLGSDEKGKNITTLTAFIQDILAENLFSNKMLDTLLGLLFPLLTSIFDETLPSMLATKIQGKRISDFATDTGSFYVNGGILWFYFNGYTTAWSENADGGVTGTYTGGSPSNYLTNNFVDVTSKAAGIYIYPSTLGSYFQNITTSAGLTAAQVNLVKAIGQKISAVGNTTMQWNNYHGRNAWDKFKDADGEFVFNGGNGFDWGVDAQTSFDGKYNQFKAMLGAMLGSAIGILRALFGDQTFSLNMNGSYNEGKNLLYGHVEDLDVGYDLGILGTPKSTGNWLDVGNIQASLSIPGLNLYKVVWIPLMEALGMNMGADGVFTWSVPNVSGNFTGPALAGYLIDPVYQLVLAISNKPVESVCKLLPNLAYHLLNNSIQNLLSINININLVLSDLSIKDAGGGIAAYAASWDWVKRIILNAAKDALNFNIPVALGDMLNLEDLLGFSLRDLNTVLAGVLGMIKEDSDAVYEVQIGTDADGNPIMEKRCRYLPGIGTGKLATMFKSGGFVTNASTNGARPNGVTRTYVKADVEYVFYAIFNYVFRAAQTKGGLADIFALIEALAGSNVGENIPAIVYSLVEGIESADLAFAALIELLNEPEYSVSGYNWYKKSASNQPTINWSTTTFTYLNYSNKWTSEKAKYIYNNVDNIVNAVVNMITPESLEDFGGDVNVWLDKTINSMFNNEGIMNVVEIVTTIANAMKGMNGLVKLLRQQLTSSVASDPEVNIYAWYNVFGYIYDDYRNVELEQNQFLAYNQIAKQVYVYEAVAKDKEVENFVASLKAGTQAQTNKSASDYLPYTWKIVSAYPVAPGESIPWTINGQVMSRSNIVPYNKNATNDAYQVYENLFSNVRWTEATDPSGGEDPYYTWEIKLTADTISHLKVNGTTLTRNGNTYIDDGVSYTVGSWYPLVDGGKIDDPTSENARAVFSAVFSELIGPFSTLFGFILYGKDLNLFGGNLTIQGYNGYNHALIPFLEALGIYDLKTEAQMNAYLNSNGTRAAFDYLVNKLFEGMDELLTDDRVYDADGNVVSGKGAFQKLVDVLPHLFYFLQSDGLTTVIKNSLMFVWQLLDTLRPIANINLDDIIHAALCRILGYVYKAEGRYAHNNLTTALLEMIGIDEAKYTAAAATRDAAKVSAIFDFSLQHMTLQGVYRLVTGLTGLNIYPLTYALEGMVEVAIANDLLKELTYSATQNEEWRYTSYLVPNTSNTYRTYTLNFPGQDTITVTLEALLDILKYEGNAAALDELMGTVNDYLPGSMNLLTGEGLGGLIQAIVKILDDQPYGIEVERPNWDYIFENQRVIYADGNERAWADIITTNEKQPDSASRWAALTAITNVNNYDFSRYHAQTLYNLQYLTSWTEDTAEATYEVLSSVLDYVVSLIDLSDMFEEGTDVSTFSAVVDALLSQKVFTPDLMISLLDMLANVYTYLPDDLLDVINHLLTDNAAEGATVDMFAWRDAGYIIQDYPWNEDGTQDTTADKVWQANRNYDWFVEGNAKYINSESTFIDAIGELLKPAGTLFALIFLNEDYDLLESMNTNSANNYDSVVINATAAYATALVPIFEALGVDLTNYQPSKYDNGDGTYNGSLFITDLVEIIDTLFKDIIYGPNGQGGPVMWIIENLPNIIYFINADGLKASINNVFGSINGVLDAIETVVKLPVDFHNLLDSGLDLTDITMEGIFGMIYSLTKSYADDGTVIPGLYMSPSLLSYIQSIYIGKIEAFTSANGYQSFRMTYSHTGDERAEEEHDMITILLATLLEYATDSGTFYDNVDSHGNEIAYNNAEALDRLLFKDSDMEGLIGQVIHALRNPEALVVTDMDWNYFNHDVTLTTDTAAEPVTVPYYAFQYLNWTTEWTYTKAETASDEFENLIFQVLKMLVPSNEDDIEEGSLMEKVKNADDMGDILSIDFIFSGDLLNTVLDFVANLLYGEDSKLNEDMIKLIGYVLGGDLTQWNGTAYAFDTVEANADGTWTLPAGAQPETIADIAGNQIYYLANQVVEVPEVKDKDGNVVTPATTKTVEKLYLVREGNSKDFIAALVKILEPAKGILAWLLFGEDYTFFNPHDSRDEYLLSIPGSNGYKDGLALLLEAFGADSNMKYAEAYIGHTDQFIYDLASSIAEKANAICNDPVNEVVGLIPELIYFINAGGLAKTVTGLLSGPLGLVNQVSALAPAIQSMLDLPETATSAVDEESQYALIELTVDSLLKSIFADQGYTVPVKADGTTDIDFKLTGINLAYVFNILEVITGMEITDVIGNRLDLFAIGQIHAYDSKSGSIGEPALAYKMGFNANSAQGGNDAFADFITILLSAVVDIVEYKDASDNYANVTALAKLLGIEQYESLITAVVKLLKGALNTEILPIDWFYFDGDLSRYVVDDETGKLKLRDPQPEITEGSLNDIPEATINYLTYASDWTKSTSEYIVDHFSEIVDGVLGMFVKDEETGASKTLTDIINDNFSLENDVFTYENYAAVVEGVSGIAEQIPDVVNTLLNIALEMDLSSLGSLATLTEDQYNALDGEGKKNAFVSAIIAIATPLRPILEWFLFNQNLEYFDKKTDSGIETLISLGGASGYNDALVPLLEAIGVDCPSYTVSDGDTAAQRNVKFGNFLSILIEKVLMRVEEILQDPADAIINLLPNLIYFVNTNALATIINNLLAPIIGLVNEAAPVLVSLTADIDPDAPDADQDDMMVKLAKALKEYNVTAESTLDMADVIGIILALFKDENSAEEDTGLVDYVLQNINFTKLDLVAILQLVEGILAGGYIGDKAVNLKILDVVGADKIDNFYLNGIEYFKSANGKPAFRMPGSADMITVIVNFVLEVLLYQDGDFSNAAEIDKLINDEEDPANLVQKVVDLIYGIREIQEVDPAALDWNYWDHEQTLGDGITVPSHKFVYLDYSNQWSFEKAVYIDNGLEDIVKQILTLAGVEDGDISKLIGQYVNLADYLNAETLQTILDAINGLFNSGDITLPKALTDLIGLVLNVDLSKWDGSYDFVADGTATAEANGLGYYTETVDGKEIRHYIINTDNDDYSDFSSGLQIILEPAQGLLGWLLLGNTFGFFVPSENGNVDDDGNRLHNELIRVPGSNGYDSGLVLLLEALGCEGLKPYTAYETAAGSGTYDCAALIKDVIDSVLARVNVILANPIEEILALIPEIIYFININGLGAVVQNFASVLLAIVNEVLESGLLDSMVEGDLAKYLTENGDGTNAEGEPYNGTYKVDLDAIMTDLLKELLGDKAPADFTFSFDDVDLQFVIDMVEIFTGLEIDDVVGYTMDKFIIGVVESYDSASTTYEDTYKLRFNTAELDENGNADHTLIGQTRADMITILISLVLDLLDNTDNVNALVALIGNEDITADTINAIVALLKGGNLDEMIDIDWFYFDPDHSIYKADGITEKDPKPVIDYSTTIATPARTINYIEYYTDWTKEDADYLVNNIDAIISEVLGMVPGIDADNVAELIAGYFTVDQIYTKDLFVTILDAIQGLIDNYGETLVNAIGLIIGGDFSVYANIDTDALVVNDKETFVDTLVTVLEPIYELLNWFLFGEDMKYFYDNEFYRNGGGETTEALYDDARDLINLTGAEGYKYGLVPLLEALGVELPAFPASGKLVAGEDFMKELLTAVFTRVEDILADPVHEIVALLPELLYFINAGGLTASLYNLLNAVVGLLPQISEVIAALGVEVKINDKVYTEINIDDIVNDLLANYLPEGSNVTVNLKHVTLLTIAEIVEAFTGMEITDIVTKENIRYFYFGKLVSYPSGSGKTGFKMVYSDAEGEAEMITLLLNFIIEVILYKNEETGADNVAALEKLLGLDDSNKDLVDTIVKLITGDKDIYTYKYNEMKWNYFDETVTIKTEDPETGVITVNTALTVPTSQFIYLEYENDWTLPRADGIDKNLASLIDGILPLVMEDATSLSDLLNGYYEDFAMDTIFTADNLNTILELLQTYLYGEDAVIGQHLAEFAGLVLGADITGWNFTYSFADYDESTTYITDGTGLRYNADSGIKVYAIENEEDFINGLTLLLQPAGKLLGWLLLGESYNFFAVDQDATQTKTLINIPGSDGYGNALALLLEALGVKGLKKSAAYNGDGVALLKDILTGLVNRIDEIIADPVNEVLDLIPELIYFINANGLSVIVNNFAGLLLNVVNAVVEKLDLSSLNSDILDDMIVDGKLDPVKYLEGYVTDLLNKYAYEPVTFTLDGVNTGWAVEVIESLTDLQIMEVLGTDYPISKFVLGTPTKYDTVSNFDVAYKIAFPETDKYNYRCDLITIVLSFAIELLENAHNQVVIEDEFKLTAGIISDVLALVKERAIQITPDYEWFYFDSAATFNGTDITVTTPERTINYLTYASNWSEDFADYLDDHLNGIIASVLKMAGQGDTSVAKIIEGVFSMKSVYTADNLNTIVNAIKDLVGQLDQLITDAVGEEADNNVIADALDLILDIDIHAWDNMTFDEALVSDKEGFSKALAQIVAPLSDVLNWLFFGSSIRLFNRRHTDTGVVDDILVINGYDGYNEGLVPLLEALGVDLTDAKNTATIEEKVEKILLAAFTRVEEILANPVDEVLALLPELFYFINANGLAASVNHLLGAPLSLVDGINALLKDLSIELNIAGNAYDEIDIDGLLNSLLNNALADKLNGKELVINTKKLDLVEIVKIVELFTGLELVDVVTETKLDNFYLGQIYSYESANGKTLFKMGYSEDAQKDRADMITVLVNFLAEAALYEDNDAVIEDLAGLDEGTIEEIINALETLGGKDYEYDWNYFEGTYEEAFDRYATPDTPFNNYLTYKSDWTKTLANDLYNNLDTIINSVLAMTGNESSTLGELINKSFTLYKGEYLNKILELVQKLYDVLDETLLGAIDAFLDIDLTYWKSLHFDETKTYTSSEFAAAVVEIVKPIYSVIDWLFFGKDITLFVDNATGTENLIVIQSVDAYTTGLVPVLEALGVELPAYDGTQKCSTKVDVNGVQMDFFAAIVNAILRRVDTILADPINEAFELLPELLYFINANGLSTAVYNMVGGVIDAVNKVIELGFLDLGSENIEQYVLDNFNIDLNKLDLVGLFNIVENLDAVHGLKLNDVFTGDFNEDGVEENILEYFYIGDYANAYISSAENYKGYKLSLDEENKGDLLTMLLSVVLEVILYDANEGPITEIIKGFREDFTQENFHTLKLLLTTGIQTNPEMLNINWVYFWNYSEEELQAKITEALSNETTNWPAEPVERTQNALKYSNNWNTDVRDYLNQNIDEIVDLAIAKFTDANSLSDLLANKLDLWSSKDVNPDSIDLANLLLGYIKNALGKIDGVLVDTVGSLLGAGQLTALKNAQAVGLESKEDFVDFMVETLSPLSPVLDFVLFGGEYKFFTHLSDGEPWTIILKGGEGYKYGLAPILAALGVDTDISAETADVALRDVFTNLVNRIDDILYGGDTINEALKLILNVIYFINADGLSISVTNLLAPIDELLKEVNDELHIKDELTINSLIKNVDLANLNFDFIFDLVENKTNIDIGTPIGDYLKNFYFGATEYFTSYDELGNFRMVYSEKENRIDFITVVVTLLLDVIVYADNRDAFISLLGSAANMEEQKAAASFDALVALLTNNEMSIPMAKYEWNFLKYADTGTVISAANGLTGNSIFGTGIYGPLYTREMGAYISKFLPLFIDTYLVLLGVDNGNGGTYKSLEEILKKLIGNNIYTNKILQQLAGAITGAVANLKETIGDQLFNHIVNVLNASLGVDLNDLLYGRVATITEGNQQQFIKAICDLLAPVAPLLRWLLSSDTDIALFNHDTVVNSGDNYAAGDDYLVIHGADGYQNAIIPILEALCVGTNGNIKTQAEFDAITDNSQMISTIITPIFERLNNILNDPINEILKELPAVVYFLNSYGLDTAVKNLLNPVYSLLYTIEPLIADVDALHNSKGEIDLLAMANIDLSELTANSLIQMVIDMVSDQISGFDLTDMIGDAVIELSIGTVDSFTSKRILPEEQIGTAYKSDASKTRQVSGGNAIDYTMNYSKDGAGGDKVDYVTILLRLLLKFISIPQNVTALEALLKTKLNGDGYKFVCSLLENFSQMAASEGGMDKIMYTVYYIFYAALNAGVATNNGLAKFNGDYTFLNQLFATSNVGFLRQLEISLGDLLNKYTPDVVNDHEVIPNGQISFWQKILNFFKKIGDFFRNLFNFG